MQISANQSIDEQYSMNKKKTFQGSPPITITPEQQLWKLITLEQKLQIASLLRIVKKAYQDDIYLGLVAYMRFKVPRPFDNPLMQMLYEQCLSIVTNHS